MTERDAECKRSCLVEGKGQPGLNHPQIPVTLVMQAVRPTVNHIVDFIHYRLPPL